MSGQLGDLPPPSMASPKKQPPAPAPTSTPTPAAIDSKPVVAAELTPPAPETKVEPPSAPTPDHDASLSVNAPPPEIIPQETPSNEQKQPEAAEPVSEPVTHPELEAPVLESVVESVPAVEQQQNSTEKIAEDLPQPEPEPSNSVQQTQSAPVSDLPAVLQQQTGSLNASEDLSVPLQHEHLLTNTGLDKASVPAEVGAEPEISQGEDAAPLTDNEKVEPTTETLPEGTANSLEPIPFSVPEAVTQEVSLDSKLDSTDVKDEKIIESELCKPTEKPQLEEAQASPAVTEDPAPNMEKIDITKEPEPDSVSNNSESEITVEVKAEPERPVLAQDAPPSLVEAVEQVSSVDLTEVHKLDETQIELSQEPAKCIESESSPVSEKPPDSTSEEKGQSHKLEDKLVDKETEPVPADNSPPVAPVEANDKSTVEEKVIEKVITEKEIVKHEIHEKAGEEAIEDEAEEVVKKERVEERVIEKVDIEMKSSNGNACEEEAGEKDAAAGRAPEVNADKGETFEEAAIQQDTAVKANDQKPLEVELNKAEWVRAPSLTRTEKAKTAEALKEPGEKEVVTKVGSPTSPSDMAKLENTVLPILEAQANMQPKVEEEKLTDTLKARRKLEVLPLSPDSPSSEDDRELSEKNTQGSAKRKLLVPMDIRADSLDDSSESFGKESPMSGDDEEFIRKQIMEMSENEDASPSDEENLIRRKIREDEKKKMEQRRTENIERSASGKARRLTKKSSISPDDEEKQLRCSLDKTDIDKEEGPELKEVERQIGTAVRKFQSMELNATSSPVGINNDDKEPEMECLTDSPDDKSRGEGSSSLHASSFTPGTSPTSLSSLDEDSDSSSPSHIRSDEGKQHRKAKHRQPGQMLPTIEDSSEEEELREEEELLREQEKQRGSGKKSKKDKEEIRGQRRRERPKTPPSNLSPIEDASPTEELRQEAEMEEIRRSSCSDFSPSIESDPEGFEIPASKIVAVQKTYQLPISVSLHSPTDDQNTDNPQKKTLKSADEAYEEILLRAKSPTIDKGEIRPEKESLYGGMLIEDYAYTSLIDNSTADREDPEKIIVPGQSKILRSPDEVYEDMVKKRKEFIKLEQEYQNMQPKQNSTTPEIVLQPAENTHSRSSTVTLGKDGKPLLDAEAAYEELMKRVLTPGTSPTQETEVDATASRRALHPIPDLRVTQCSSGELSSDDENMVKREEDATAASDTTSAKETDTFIVISESPPSSPLEQPPTTIAASQADVVDLSGAFPRMSTPVIASVSPLPTVPQYTPGCSNSDPTRDSGYDHNPRTIYKTGSYTNVQTSCSPSRSTKAISSCWDWR
ncbi:unnamed protein product [Pleuronectes platessa]|uniref:Uncharacterized protein n=1 Tax=Pleuronectes platessa TaxID=8262 RepID=A0A9N7TY12_PLEPL|nr:unnamed protein product [Pleuronectes platessa]